MGAWPEAGDEAFDRAPAPLVLVDATDGTVLAANRAMARRLGVEPARLEGLVWPTPLGGSRADFAAIRDHLGRSEEAVIESLMGERIDPVWWRQSITRVVPPDANPYLIVMVEDRTREHQVTSELTRAADHDELTGLWNRRRFRRELRVAMAGAGPDVGLVLFDVDAFKQVNDTFGHPAGDAALVAVAALIRSVSPRGSGVARLSGDEFAVLVRDEPEQIAATCTRLADQAGRVVVGDGLPEIHLSAGWAIGRPGDGPEQRVHALMVEADLAMYAAKARARAQRVDPIGPAVDEASVAEAWPADGVIVETGIELWTHPVLDCRSGAVALHDVVLRGPSSSVNLGALVRILEMVQRHSARLVGSPARYLVHLRDFPLGVGSAIKWLGRTSVDVGLPAGAVTFALPERLLLDQTRSAHQVLRSLGEEGFGLAVDGFGVDTASMRLLVDLRPDQVWLDRRLLLAEDRHPVDVVARGHLVVEATVHLARALGARVGIAGAIDQEVLDLAALGIDLALVPEDSAFRPLGVVATDAEVRAVGAETEPPRPTGSRRGC